MSKFVRFGDPALRGVVKSLLSSALEQDLAQVLLAERAEKEEYRTINHMVAVCSQHSKEIIDGKQLENCCYVCAFEAEREAHRKLREAVKVFDHVKLTDNLCATKEYLDMVMLAREVNND